MAETPTGGSPTTVGRLLRSAPFRSPSLSSASSPSFCEERTAAFRYVAVIVRGSGNPPPPPPNPLAKLPSALEASPEKDEEPWPPTLSLEEGATVLRVVFSGAPLLGGSGPPNSSSLSAAAAARDGDGIASDTTVGVWCANSLICFFEFTRVPFLCTCDFFYFPEKFVCLVLLCVLSPFVLLLSS